MHLTFLAKTTTCLLAAGLLMQANAFGASWTAGTGNWADPDNWEGGVVPDLNNEGAAIANGGTAQITSNVAARTLTIAARNTTGHLEILAGGTLSVGILNMSRLGGSDATLVIRGGALVGPVLNNTDIEVATPNLDYQYSTGLIVVSEGGSLSIPWQITLGRLKGQATLQIGEGGAAGTVVADRIIGQGTGGGSGSVVFNHNESDYAFGTQIGSEYNGDTYSSAVRVVQDGPGVPTLTHTNY